MASDGSDHHQHVLHDPRRHDLPLHLRHRLHLVHAQHRLHLRHLQRRQVNFFGPQVQQEVDR